MSIKLSGGIFDEKSQIKLTDVFEIDIIELSKARKQLKLGNSGEIGSLKSWIKFLINPIEWEESKMDDKDLNEEIKKAYEIWKSLTLNSEERDAAERRYLDLVSYQYGKEYEFNEGIKAGIKAGIKEGIECNKKEVAKKMLKNGEDIEKIILYTGLSSEELDELKKEL